MARTKHHTPDYNDTAKGNFRLAYHLEMVSDQERVGQFKKAIDQVVSEDTIFCEVTVIAGAPLTSLRGGAKRRRSNLLSPRGRACLPVGRVGRDKGEGWL